MEQRQTRRRRRLALLLALVMALLTFLVGGLGRERLGQLATGVADLGARVVDTSVLDVLLGRDTLEPNGSGASELATTPPVLASAIPLDELVPQVPARTRLVAQAGESVPLRPAPSVPAPAPRVRQPAPSPHVVSSPTPQKPADDGEMGGASPVAPAQRDLARLRPVLQCVEVAANGVSITAVYGYENAGDMPLLVPVGDKNFFEPGDPDRGQPTAFAPGLHAGVVEVEGPGNVSWRLGQRSATATPAAPRCNESEPEPEPKPKPQPARKPEEPEAPAKVERKPKTETKPEAERKTEPKDKPPAKTQPKLEEPGTTEPKPQEPAVTEPKPQEPGTTAPKPQEPGTTAPKPEPAPEPPKDEVVSDEPVPGPVPETKPGGRVGFEIGRRIGWGGATPPGLDNKGGTPPGQDKQDQKQEKRQDQSQGANPGANAKGQAQGVGTDKNQQPAGPAGPVGPKEGLPARAEDARTTRSRRGRTPSSPSLRA